MQFALSLLYQRVKKHGFIRNLNHLVCSYSLSVNVAFVQKGSNMTQKEIIINNIILDIIAAQIIYFEKCTITVKNFKRFLQMFQKQVKVSLKQNSFH